MGKQQKPSMWVSYIIERNQYWTPGVLITRFLNDPESPGLKDYEIISASVIEITEHRIEILVRQRALT